MFNELVEANKPIDKPDIMGMVLLENINKYKKQTEMDIIMSLYIDSNSRYVLILIANFYLKNPYCIQCRQKS